MDEKIIHFVRTHKYMYDKTDKSYKNTVLKEKKWNQLSDELDQSVGKIKKRWKVMRDRYLRVLKQNYLRNSHGREIKYKYYDLLSFLSEGRDYNRSGYIELVDEPISRESVELPYNSIVQHNGTAVFFDKFYETSSSRSEAPITQIPTLPKQVSSTSDYHNNITNETNAHESQTPQPLETPISCHMKGLGLLLEAANWSSERLLKFQAKHTLFILNELKK